MGAIPREQHAHAFKSVSLPSFCLRPRARAEAYGFARRSADYFSGTDASQNNQTNMAIKGIIGLAAMAKMAEIADVSSDQSTFNVSTLSQADRLGSC